MKLKKKAKKKFIRILISFICFTALFIWDHIAPIGDGLSTPFNWILPCVLYLAVYIYIGYDVLSRAFLNILHLEFLDENFLMCLASLGAFTLAVLKGIRGETIEGFDEACAVLLFYQIGEFFEDCATNQSRESIRALLAIRPDFARKVVENSVVELAPEEVHVGDIIRVYAGERIPLDGTLQSESVTLDLKALTGESLPKEKRCGDDLLSGAIVLDHEIDLLVTKESANSTITKILNLIENAQEKKSKQESFITVFAKYYTPIVIGIAILVAFAPFLFIGITTGNWATLSTWLYRALSFLVVSCPCAIVISVPLTFFAGIGCASRHGILFKGSSAIEQLAKADTYVFDKTGTLTQGNFKVTSCIPQDSMKTLLFVAACAEQHLSHPIARAIQEAYGASIDDSYVPSNVTGKGVKAQKGEETILCGSRKFLGEEGIECPAWNQVGTLVYIAQNGKYLGALCIEDTIKPEASKALSLLHNKTMMLTGDEESIAKKVAESTGVDAYKASLLPEDKVQIVEELQRENQVVFVGDGMNDAPVLSCANVGIAMGGVGCDAAIEAADAVLMKDSLYDLLTAKNIAHKTVFIAKENVWGSISIKVLIMILSALGIGSMWIAVFGDVGVCVLAILNALRVNNIKRGAL